MNISVITRVIYHLAFACTMLGIFFCFLRMVLGKTLSDRVVALDLTVNILISFIAIYSILSGYSVYIDVVIALALIIFLGTVSFAQLIARQSGSKFLSKSINNKGNK